MRLYQGDVRNALGKGTWDAILLDVDNGPDAFTMEKNARLYGNHGLSRIESLLHPGGILVVWSAYESPDFKARLQRAGLDAGAKRVRARGKIKKGAMHILYFGKKR